MSSYRFVDTHSLNLIYGSLSDCKKRMNNVTSIFKMNNFRWYIRVFDSLEEMNAFFGCTLPNWIKAVSYNNIICFLNKDKWIESEINGYNDILVHESVHCLTRKRYGLRIPRWFDEGVAMYFGGQIGQITERIFLPEDKLITSLGYKDPLLYRYSAQFINDLIKKYGIEKVLSFADSTNCFENDGILGDKAIRELYCKEI